MTNIFVRRAHSCLAVGCELLSTVRNRISDFSTDKTLLWHGFRSLKYEIANSLVPVMVCGDRQLRDGLNVYIIFKACFANRIRRTHECNRLSIVGALVLSKPVQMVPHIVYLHLMALTSVAFSWVLHVHYKLLGFAVWLAEVKGAN